MPILSWSWKDKFLRVGTPYEPEALWMQNKKIIYNITPVQINLFQQKRFPVFLPRFWSDLILNTEMIWSLCWEWPLVYENGEPGRVTWSSTRRSKARIVLCRAQGNTRLPVPGPRWLNNRVRLKTILTTINIFNFGWTKTTSAFFVSSKRGD